MGRVDLECRRWPSMAESFLESFESLSGLGRRVAGHRGRSRAAGQTGCCRRAVRRRARRRSRRRWRVGLRVVAGEWSGPERRTDRSLESTEAWIGHLATVASANAKAATIAALELLNAAVMTSPLDLTISLPARLLLSPRDATAHTCAASLQPLDVSMAPRWQRNS